MPFPAIDLLTYRVPDGFELPQVGARVLVPLGQRTVTGCVVAHGPDRFLMPDRTACKCIIDILDPEALLPSDILRLARWIAEYYACGPGEAIAAAMPPFAWLASHRVATLTERGREALQAGGCSGVAGRVLARLLAANRPLPVSALAGELLPHAAPRPRRRQASRSGAEKTRMRAVIARLAKAGLLEITQAVRGRTAAFKHVKMAALTAAGAARAAASDRDPRHTLGARQQKALALLAQSSVPLELSSLAADGIARDAIRRLEARGLVTVFNRQIDRDPAPLWSQPECPAAAPTLTAEQTDALERLSLLIRRGTFHSVLLHGVTGSGKTELYLRLAALARQNGRGVLLLVPEIALTPAALVTFQRTFGERVAIQHSGLADGERHDQWFRIRRSEMDVVIGTRSAVFAPVASLGLIVVDEEHDASYKQEESPRYHARDVAVMRAKQAGALVILGSATPSLETFHNASRGRYERIALTRRVLDRPLPAVQVVDMREEYASGGPQTVLSRMLGQALLERMERHEQSLVLLNRRGFATAVLCRQCGSTLECPNCSVSLTIHKAAGRARCHYCNYATAVPRSCRHCGGPFLELAGFGTERVQEEILRLAPHARVGRLDRDTARVRGASAAILQKFAQGEIDVLVGTQMIAKGHDFPRVTLVGVISADVGLGLADFHASERTFQLLTQVAGRAGRGEQSGQAIVQTLFPNHYSIRYGCAQDYQAFFDAEMQFRRAMRYPPAVALINLVMRGPAFARAMADATRLIGRLRTRAFRIVGPAPAPFVKLRGEYRAQFFLKGLSRAVMREALLAALAREPHLRRRVTIDVDPLSVL